MIQEPIMEMLRDELPDLEWSIDYRTGRNDTGTVYSTGGSGLDDYEVPFRYPTYQVYIRSRDWDYAKLASEIVFQRLHNKRNFPVKVNYYKNNDIVTTKHYFVHLISAMSDPIRLGVEDDEFMDYSVNFDVVLSEVKEESING